MYADPEELAQVEGLDARTGPFWRTRAYRGGPHPGGLRRGDMFLLTMQDAAYPARLRDIFDPPVLLYGKRPAAVAAVRQGAHRGWCPAWPRASTAPPCGAHCRQEGFTAAVLGGGVDVVYPAENRRLYEDIAATGVLLSEYPRGTEPCRGISPCETASSAA